MTKFCTVFGEKNTKSLLSLFPLAILKTFSLVDMRLILRDTRKKKEILENVFYGIKTVEFPNCVLYLVIVVFWGASLVAQWVKNLSAVQETWIRCPGQEDPLEKEMATHSSILSWRIPWTEESGRLQSMESTIVIFLN